MEKSNQKLLVGLLLGILLGLVVALYVIDFFPIISTFLVYSLIAIFFIILIGALSYIWFKDKILQKIFGEDFKEELAKKELQQLYEQIAENFIDKLLQGLPDKKRAKIKLTTPRLIRLCFWLITRTWILRLLVAVFIAVGGLLGTILLYNQNLLLTSQNERIKIQNDILERGQRRSSISLLNGVLDQVDLEISTQKSSFGLSLGVQSDSITYVLEEHLIHRIIALSRALQPYEELDDEGKTRLVSRERGHLFLAVLGNHLNPKTQNIIVQDGDFRYALIHKIDLGGAKLVRGSLQGANLSNSNFTKANLSNIDLRNAILKKCDFSEARLFEARLDTAIIINSKFTGSYLNGVFLNYANLSHSNLNKSSCFDAKFNGANLNHTQLREVNLGSARLMHVTLEHSDLSRAELVNAKLSNANLKNAILVSANLTGADLKHAKLDNADLSNAILSGVTNLSVNQLVKVKSLFDCKGLDKDLSMQLKKIKPELFKRDDPKFWSPSNYYKE